MQYTSTPLGIDVGGIMDIFLGQNSALLYLGGITEEISLGGNAKAELRGGTITGITIGRRPQDSCYATIYCQEGYTKNAAGISGLWKDGSAFNIQFVNVGGPYPPTANFVNVVEVVPEPASLVLLGLGGLMIRRKTR